MGKMGEVERRGLHGGKWVFARVEVGAARGEVGVGQGEWGDCGRFFPRGGHFAVVFQGKRPENGFPVEKWAAVSAQWPGTGGFSEGSSDMVSCRPSPSVFGLRRFFVGGLPFQLLGRPGLVQLLDVVPEGLVDAHVHAARQKGVDVVIVKVHMDGAVGNAFDLLHRLVEGADDGLVIVAVLDLLLGGQADVVDDVIDLDAEAAVFVDETVRQE